MGIYSKGKESVRLFRSSPVVTRCRSFADHRPVSPKTRTTSLIEYLPRHAGHGESETYLSRDNADLDFR